jgi:hypothetical protein
MGPLTTADSVPVTLAPLTGESPLAAGVAFGGTLATGYNGLPSGVKNLLNGIGGGGSVPGYGTIDPTQAGAGLPY